MISDFEVIYCEDDGNFRVYCDNFDNICIEGFFQKSFEIWSSY